MNRTGYFLYASCRCIGIDHACFEQAQLTKIPHYYHNSPIKQIRNSNNSNNSTSQTSFLTFHHQNLLFNLKKGTFPNHILISIVIRS